jgi:OmpA-OmpF porin, OOP family
MKNRSMKYLNTSAALGLAALSVLAAPAAMAQNQNTYTSGWYLGGNIGRTNQDIDDASIVNGLAVQGRTTTSIEHTGHDRGYKLFGGYQLNRNFAIEGGYFDLGSFGYTARTLPLGSQTGDVGYKGVNLDLVGIVPFTEKFSAFGRVGVTSTRASSSYSSTGAAGVPFGTSSGRSTNAKYGVGVMYDFTPSLAMRVEAERYHVKDAFRNKDHVDMVSVGLVYRFGAAPVRTAYVAPAPVYVAPAPAPAPMVVAPPPPPAPVYVAPPAPAPAPVMAPEPRPAKPYRN